MKNRNDLSRCASCARECVGSPVEHCHWRPFSVYEYPEVIHPGARSNNCDVAVIVLFNAGFRIGAIARMMRINYSRVKKIVERKHDAYKP